MVEDKITVERVISFKKIRLLERESILAEEICTLQEYKSVKGQKFLVNKEVISTKNCVFPLREIAEEEVATLRKSQKPSFLLKENGIYYYAEIPRNLALVASSFMGQHACAHNGQTCNRLSAAKDEDGGCQKTRERATGIEKYPWIVAGYETWGTVRDCFIVLECEHYEKPQRRPKPSQKYVSDMKLGLSYFMWESGAQTIEEMEERIRKNIAKGGGKYL